ncbi:MAG: DUF2062 domain-containing protein [Burkholderiales bacterium]|nr:DUF2062 domain-containing protein [Burkholderiales bacterium]
MRAQRGLRWLGPLLERPWLWQFNRRTVAVGVGVGVFFGFIVPILQIAGAAVFAVLLRGNLPVAAASTLVSNPFTYAPIAVAAYHVGSALIGAPEGEAPASATSGDAPSASVTHAAARPWWKRLSGMGKQVLVGLVTFAVVGGVGSFFLTHLIWHATTRLRIRGRRRRRRAAADRARS